jgi:Double-stranded RNA binding motif
MMDELKKLPPLSPVEEVPNRANSKIRRKQLQLQQQQQTPVSFFCPTLYFPYFLMCLNILTTQMVKKKSRNLIKEKLEASSGVDEINPISQLIQIQQARKEKEPVYTVVDERGTARRREFVIEVSAGGLSASGTGPNKKLAKKIAAESEIVSIKVTKLFMINFYFRLAHRHGNWEVFNLFLDFCLFRLLLMTFQLHQNQSRPPQKRHLLL